MKQDIHPPYFPAAKAQCACGNTFEVGATKETIQLDVCSSCHPFYTGQEKMLDKMGQIQKFKKRLALKEPKRKTRKGK